jgi:hypothetical protein
MLTMMAHRPDWQALLAETEVMFAWWNKLRDEEINRAEFQEIMKPIP